MKTKLGLMVLIAAGLAAWLLARSPAQARSPRQVTWPSIALVQLVGDFAAPVHVTHAGDGSGRLFVVEQPGRIRFFKNGAAQATPFLDIDDRVLYSGEQGLLSVAFPPNYAQKGYFFVYYTNKQGNNQVSRFSISADPDVANPNSEFPVIIIPHPGQTNHNGGQIAFGPDGYLYIAPGDGGGGGDPAGNGQKPSTLLGKVLRIHVEPGAMPPGGSFITTYLPMLSGGSTLPPLGYRIPPDNPFVNTPGYRPELWALGLRNPWRFSFDRQTGDLYIGDVGQGDREEVDFQPAASPGGENYGWNILEGNICYPPGTPCTPPPNYSPPVAVYNHTLGCSISGGVIYRGAGYPNLQGFYFYADYCSGRIWALTRDNGAWVDDMRLDTPLNITSFGESQSGEVYLTATDGKIYQLIQAP